MPRISAKSENEKIECFYDSKFDTNTFLLTLPQNSNFVAVRVDKYEINNMIETLQDFSKKMRFAGAIK